MIGSALAQLVLVSQTEIGNFMKPAIPCIYQKCAKIVFIVDSYIR